MLPDKKNIAIIIDSLAGGGAEKVMITLASEFVTRGHRVVFFAFKKEGEYNVPSKIELIYPFSEYNGRLRGWFNGKQLAPMLSNAVKQSELKHGEFDAVLVNLHESYRLASACGLKNAYYIIHNSYVNELKREKRMGPVKYMYMQRILKQLSGKRLIAVSEGVAQELRNARLFKPAQVDCIYNPFDIQQIRSLAKKEPHKTPPQKFIVHVGRAAKAKRHDILFMALKDINPEYKLVCLSSNTRKLTKLAIKYGVEDRLVLPGFTSNPYAWIARADALVLSSDFEGLPTVLIEAIICATKIVSTNCQHGPSEIMQGELAQFLVRPRSPEALAEAVNEVLKCDIDLADYPLLKRIDAATIADNYLDLASLS